MYKVGVSFSGIMTIPNFVEIHYVVKSRKEGGTAL
jgi:hypothetical protein